MARTRYSAILADLRGRVGNEVFTRTRAGATTRRRPRYRYPVTPNVEAGNERFRAATAVWRELTLPEIEAWRAYASRQFRTDPVTETRYAMSARTAFTGLATKFLQINPEGSVPRLPPVSDFAGDELTLSVTPIAGGLHFTASEANTPGTETELLIQPLPNIRCAPKAFYRSAGFVEFTAGSLGQDVPLPVGGYAVAFRFVRVESGQATREVKIGIFEVSA